MGRRHSAVFELREGPESSVKSCAHRGPIAGLPVKITVSSAPVEVGIQLIPEGDRMMGSVMLVQCRRCYLFGHFDDDGVIRWASEVGR